MWSVWGLRGNGNRSGSAAETRSGSGDNVNNPTTWFGPLSHISGRTEPQGTVAQAVGASDTCWPLPSLPD